VEDHKSEPRDVRGVGASTESPACLTLRLRGLVGATARSEILRTLLLAGESAGLAARDLAHETGFSKATLSEALRGLRLAGVVRSDSIGNSQQHVLRSREPLTNLVGPIPPIASSQRLLTQVAQVLIDIDQSPLRSAPSSVREVETMRLVREVSKIFQGSPDRASTPQEARTSLIGAARWCRASPDVKIVAAQSNELCMRQDQPYRDSALPAA